MVIKIRVFAKGKDRYIVAGFWFPVTIPEDYDGPSESDVILDSAMLQVTGGFDPVPTEWIEVEGDAKGNCAVVNVPCFIPNKHFEHGGFEAMLISGPTFDKRCEGKEPI